MTPTEALRLLNRLLDRLDTEDDQRVRCDLITDCQDLADDFGGKVSAIARSAGIPGLA